MKIFLLIFLSFSFLIVASDEPGVLLDCDFSLKECSKVPSLQKLILNRIINSDQFCEAIQPGSCLSYDIKEDLIQLWHQKHHKQLLNLVWPYLEDTKSEFFKSGKYIDAVKLLSNGKVLVSRSEEIEVFDISGNKLQTNFKGRLKLVLKNGDIVTARQVMNKFQLKTKIKVFEADSCIVKHKIVKPYWGFINDILELPNSDIVLIFNGKVTIYDSNFAIKKELDFECYKITILADSNIALASENLVRIYNPDTWDLKFEFPFDETYVLNSILPSGKLILAKRNNRRVPIFSVQLFIYDPLFDTIIKIKENFQRRYRGRRVFHLSSGDLAMSLAKGGIGIFDFNTFEMKKFFKAKRFKISSISDSSNGDIVASSFDGAVMIWKISEPIQEFFEDAPSVLLCELEKKRKQLSDNKQQHLDIYNKASQALKPAAKLRSCTLL